MARKRHRRRWLLWLPAGVAVLLLAYLVLAPLAIAWLVASSQPGAPSPVDVRRLIALDEQLRGVVLVAFMAAWTFMLGAAVGSFLNVVAWRMPRGESIVSRPSHCPHCNTNIALRDNLPVFGWLLLRGRCRVCRLPISMRYPIVEALLGAAFLALAVAEVFTGGANLPGYQSPIGAQGGVLAAVVSPDWRLLGSYGYHCLLLSVLAAYSLIRFDGHALPTRIVVFSLAAGLALPAIWPGLQPLPWRSGFVVANWYDRPLTALYGLGAGTLLEIVADGASWRLARPAGAAFRQRWSVLAVPGTIGMFLGWQALPSVTLIAGGLAVVGAVIAHTSRFAARLPLAAWLALATLLHIALWRPLEQLPWWPGSSWLIWQLALSAAAGIVLMLSAAAIAQRAASRWQQPADREPPQVASTVNTANAINAANAVNAANAANAVNAVNADQTTVTLHPSSLPPQSLPPEALPPQAISPVKPRDAGEQQEPLP